MRKGGKVRTTELFPQKVDPFTLNLRFCKFNIKFVWINLCNFSMMTADASYNQLLLLHCCFTSTVNI